jgi:hypothetical protein
MSTGGPDPNGEAPIDPESTRNDVGDSGVGRMGMPSMLTGLLVVVMAVALVVYLLL